MKNKKRTLLLFIAFLAGIFIKCNGQSNEYPISGSWSASKGYLITSYCSPIYNPPPDKPIAVFGLKFSFDNTTVTINKSFQGYSNDSTYCWAFWGTNNQGNSNCKIKVKVLDQNNIEIKMDYLYFQYMDRIMYYVLYLKRD